MIQGVPWAPGKLSKNFGTERNSAHVGQPLFFIDEETSAHEMTHEQREA